MTQIYLIRHGETEWNAARRIQGHTDSPLTAQGMLQAAQVGQYLADEGIEKIISSDLGRAQQTAALIAEQCRCPIRADTRLREMNMGVLEARSMHELTAEEHGWRQRILDGTPQGCIPQGETLHQVSQRMRAVLDEFSCAGLGKIAFVSHGIALGSLIGSVIGLPPHAERRFRLRNCSISVLEFQDNDWLANGWVVERLGDTHHLLLPALDEVQR
ncbi:MAG: 2,3-diphosphoglycerate-dependent phosphoglycerate mutase GpmB [Plesiomonas sp.]